MTKEEVVKSLKKELAASSSLKHCLIDKEIVVAAIELLTQEVIQCQNCKWRAVVKKKSICTRLAGDFFTVNPGDHCGFAERGV